MASEHSINRYRHWYVKLLRLYPEAYHHRFAREMEQTFNDLLRERVGKEDSLLRFVIRIFCETLLAIIQQNLSVMFRQNQRLIRILLAVASILIVPLIAMQFSNEVVWTLTDFIIAGALLLGIGLTYELAARKGGNLKYRAAVLLALAATLLMVWLNLAVGIIGTESNPANLMYIGVLAVGIVGAILARHQPTKLARALFATALSQTIVTIIALVANLGSPENGPLKIVILNALFITMWIASALLFLYSHTPTLKSHPPSPEH
ncbi:MAG: hypothetical protein SFY81_00875 [Verrucomicrobiota bacterium]|nr:hypothetical protein [Verrucomicrobiota bacterium]